MDQEIKIALNKHEEHLKDCDEHFIQIDKKLKEHDNHFERIEAKLKEHDDHFERIEAKLKEHDDHFERIEAKLKEHDERFERIEAKLKEHDERFERIEEMIRGLQRSMLIIEDAVTNKIPALFDGYAMHQEKQEQLEERVNNLENFSETNSIRISALETITSEDSKQLAQLLS